jgi:predicted Zn-dependent peptidase
VSFHREARFLGELALCHSPPVSVIRPSIQKSLNYPSREGISKLLEESGALIDCQSTRDTFIYASSCHKRHAHQVLKLIADAVHRPLINEEDVSPICVAVGD